MVLTGSDVKKKPAAIELLVIPKTQFLGDLPVRRTLPVRQRRMVGPWTFVDEMGPVEFAPGSGVDVPPHPHINLATVTYLFEGEILHRDSLGTRHALKVGDLNLMVAGKGIVHSEREDAEVRDSIHRLHGLQLWLALPDAHEEIEPAFYHYPSDEIPTVHLPGVSVRVLIGGAFGVVSPVKAFCETLYLEARLERDGELVLPQFEEGAIYVVRGEVCIEGVQVQQHHLAVLSGSDALILETTDAATIVFIGGEPLGKRHMEWNFVSSKKERIEQAKLDWRERRFARIPGDDEEYIPY